MTVDELSSKQKNFRRSIDPISHEWSAGVRDLVNPPVFHWRRPEAACLANEIAEQRTGLAM